MLEQIRFDLLEYSGELFDDLLVFEAFDVQSSSFKGGCAGCVVLLGFGRVVNRAVQFNNEFGARAVEIDDVALEGFPALKSSVGDLCAAQGLPEDRFAARGILALASL